MKEAHHEYRHSSRRPNWRLPSPRLIILIVVTLAGTIAVVNVFRIVGDQSLTEIANSDDVLFDSKLLPLSAGDIASAQHRLSASLVRIEHLSSKTSGSGSDQVKLVLSVDMADLADLMDAYRHGFVPEVEQYPDDGGIVMHNQNLCRQPIKGKSESRPIKWIVYVHSSPDHTNRRQMLRDTWANLGLFKDIEFRVIFLIGQPAIPDPDLQSELKAEFDKYGDLVQGNFVDSYKNMTLKAVMGLRWLSLYCPEVPFALKADDDTFLNIFEIVPLIAANANKSNVIICPLWPENSMPILRDPKTCMKWCVKRRELRGRTHFPQYCAGIGYVVSQNLIPMLYNASRSTPFFWIDDVYVTGLLPQKLPVKPTYVDLLDRFTANENNGVEQYSNRTNKLTYWYVHAKDENKYWTMWKALMSRLTDEQKKIINADVLLRWASND